MNNLEESTKLSRETRWATIGRAIADGQERDRYLLEAELLRKQEQQSAGYESGFAGLARQIGDARAKGKDVSDLVEQTKALRKGELIGCRRQQS
jgi:hypothetical protein